MANQYNGPALMGGQHVYEDRLVNALAEIERLTALCKEYRENGDRLMRVADAYKAEIERLKEALASQRTVSHFQALKIVNAHAAQMLREIDYQLLGQWEKK